MKRVVFVAVALIIMVSLSLFGCAKPAPTLAPSPTSTPAVKPTPTPAPTSTPTAKPTPAPAPAPSLPREIGVGVPGSGSAYNAMGQGVAKILTEKSPIKVTPQSYAGTRVWMALVNDGSLAMGLCSVVDAGWAYYGGPDYATRNLNLRLALRGHYVATAMPVLVKRDSNIRTIQDLRGKKVASDYAGSAIWNVFVTAFLYSGGLTWKDVTPVPVSSSDEAMNLLKQGRVDSCVAAIGQASLDEANAAVGVRPIGFQESEDALRKFRELVPGADIATLKAGTAPYVTQDIRTIVHWSWLVASASAGEEVIYIVTKTLWDNVEQLRPIHSWFKDWSTNTMFAPDFVVPYHPGAVKFYKEKGLWTAAAEKLQQQALAQAK